MIYDPLSVVPLVKRGKRKEERGMILEGGKKEGRWKRREGSEGEKIEGGENR